MIERPAPHWERGHRCHGYWIGEHTRIGLIGMGPTFAPASIFGYSWTMDFPLDRTAAGTTRTLRQARRAVERAFAAKQEEMRRRTYHLCS